LLLLLALTARTALSNLCCARQLKISSCMAIVQRKLKKEARIMQEQEKKFLLSFKIVGKIQNNW